MSRLVDLRPGFLTEQELKKIFADNLNGLMFDRGINAYDLDDAIGITYSSIYSYTSGRCLPCSYYLYLIANYFNCTIDDLFRKG